MDKMAIEDLFNGVYTGKKVFITGHTGFKGSWIALWLIRMGAIVKGYALAPNTKPSHWELLNLDIDSIYGDIRDKSKLEKELCSFKPDVVFHMAAQPLVSYSYKKPHETYEINVMGTMSLLEACRKSMNIKAIIIITTDKCYENKEWIWGYRENEPMGGYDPYSSSKACVEILTSSYRRSYFNTDDFGIKHNTLLASVRAGNVIGGGDWADDRLIPDIMKAIAKRETAVIRNPLATRPWQHVLDPLSGYLMLGQKLIEGEKEFADAWNFGPNDSNNIAVSQVISELKKSWAEINVKYTNPGQFHEATLLMLDSTKARTFLKWKPIWDSSLFEKTSSWYREYIANNQLVTSQQLDDYIKDAVGRQSAWIKKS
jgi:CDP-glucose 4,6-dehydratase